MHSTVSSSEIGAHIFGKGREGSSRNPFSCLRSQLEISTSGGKDRKIVSKWGAKRSNMCCVVVDLTIMGFWKLS